MSPSTKSSEPNKDDSTKKNSDSDNLENSAETVANGLNVLIQHAKRDLTLKHEPPTLSHYRTIPNNLQTAHELLLQGSKLVRATATKYALVGAIDTKDHMEIGMDLLRGCELIGAAAHVCMPDPNGCSLALRTYTQKAALAVYVATLRLVEAFHPQVVTSDNNNNTAVASKDNNVGAQKTGAVWEACDYILNKMVPTGNRNAMRRELFTLTKECNSTMEEFQELIDLGPREDEVETNDVEEDDDMFGFGDDDQYSSTELPMAQACWGLLKVSRGNLKMALEACEALGKLGESKEHLEAIRTIHQHAKTVGEGVTDLGSLLYPPLLDGQQQANDLVEGMKQQIAHIQEFQDYLLGDLSLELPLTVKELAQTLQTAANKKQKDFKEALAVAQANQ